MTLMLLMMMTLMLLMMMMLMLLLMLMMMLIDTHARSGAYSSTPHPSSSFSRCLRNNPSLLLCFHHHPLPPPSPHHHSAPPLLLLLHFALMAPVSRLQKHVLARLLRIAFVNYKLALLLLLLLSSSHHFSLCSFCRASKPHCFLPVPISIYDVTGSSPAHPPNPHSTARFSTVFTPTPAPFF